LVLQREIGDAGIARHRVPPVELGGALGMRDDRPLAGPEELAKAPHAARLPLRVLEVPAVEPAPQDGPRLLRELADLEQAAARALVDPGEDRERTAAEKA